MSSDQPLPSYRKPPVIEVVYGVSFTPLSALKAPHTGVFWADVKAEFPKIQHAQPVGPLPSEFDLGNLPLPRIWYRSEDDRTLIQVQNNRFLFNWRMIHPDDEYPRFSEVESGFRKNFARFVKFVEANELGDLDIEGYELTYINHIERNGKLSNLRNIASLFPDFRWRTPAKRFLPIPSHLTWTMGFEFGSRGRLVADLKSARRKNDDHDIFVLEMKATGKATIEGNEDPDSWFREAREWIVRGFADLTNEKAQVELWEKETPNV